MNFDTFVFFGMMIPFEFKILHLFIKLLNIDFIIQFDNNIIKFFENNKNKEIHHDILKQNYKDYKIYEVQSIDSHTIIPKI